MHVHYLLASHTVDEQMWDLVDQKWAAQRAVQDREAQHKTVEGHPGRGSAGQRAAGRGKAVLKAEFRREGATVEEAAAKAEEAVEKMATQLVDGRVPSELRQVKRRRPAAQQVAVYVGTLFNQVDRNNNSGLLPADRPALPVVPADQIVQLAFL